MRISYTANSNIVKTDFLISSETDISAATSDDSFNAATTDLSGLALDDWMLVSGFVDELNNGWHQADVASTAAKIGVVANLADEAVGPNITIQGHEHGLGISYDLETDAEQATPSVSSSKNVTPSLGGQIHTLLHNEASLWRVTTGLILKANKKYWDEFFSSVKAGEIFTFDPDGTLAAPDTVLTVKLEGDQTPVRVGHLYYKFSFVVREQ